ncbi:sigma-E factor negative regulatory protein [Piscinibacter sp.]|uniref:sigma-E factor negative regulatory protein n=1 Tax=Piscinibacter sp. TaxID=1903157 RepID=UPI002C51A505|nr:RseA family anti-sigma factor [Albitalea sp.]HUG22754.1 RseA family anti-sigma factor [Albitalea sp.]
MSIGSDGDPPALENLSALTDGELDAQAAARTCVAWRDDAVMRSNWHAYQLIGDVLRSDDLASTPARDAAFIAALRLRLADEPVVLAPDTPQDSTEATGAATGRLPAHARRGARWSWMAPSAVAAGFVLVAGALMATRAPTPVGSQPASVLAGSPAKTGPVELAGVPTLAPVESAPAARRVGDNGKLIRDPRLDRYLAAHQQFAGTSVLGVPSGFLRNAAAEASSR